MTWDGKERRRRKRYGIHNSTVQYRKSALLPFVGPKSPRYLTLNLSEVGVHFISKEQLPDGRSLSLKLEAPVLRQPIGVKGKVVWCRKSEEFDAWRIGVEFSGMSRRSRSNLKNIIDNAILDKVEISTRIYLKEIEKL